MKKKPHPKMVYVEFDDHAAGSGWRSEGEYDPEPILIKAVGWALKETKKALILGSMYDSEQRNSGVRQYIVKSCIRKRRTLRVK